MESLSWQSFTAVDMRVGTILEATDFPEARKPAYKLIIDFGDLGIKKTSAQITKCYTIKELIGKQIVAVVNFPEKQIANFMSQCLVLGSVGVDGDVILLKPDAPATNGDRIG